MWNRKRFLQVLLVGAALAGVLMIQVGPASAACSQARIALAERQQRPRAA
jgi:hypothetical protein